MNCGLYSFAQVARGFCQFSLFSRPVGGPGGAVRNSPKHSRIPNAGSRSRLSAGPYQGRDDKADSIGALRRIQPNRVKLRMARARGAFQCQGRLFPRSLPPKAANFPGGALNAAGAL